MFFRYLNKLIHSVTLINVIGVYCVCFIWGDACYAQDQIIIKGRVYADNQDDFLRVMVINKRLNNGIIGNPDGAFNIECRRSDTILVSVIGYSLVRLCFADSVNNTTFYPRLKLNKLQENLAPYEIFSKRSLKKIYQDVSQLGYSEKEYRTSGIDALKSPLTFLYQMYSKRERAKRLSYALENEQKRRDLLKELLVHYVDHDLIDLNIKEFDSFIDYCQFSDELIQKLTQYEFIQLTKHKFFEFKKYGY